MLPRIFRALWCVFHQFSKVLSYSLLKYCSCPVFSLLFFWDFNYIFFTFLLCLSLMLFSAYSIPLVTPWLILYNLFWPIYSISPILPLVPSNLQLNPTIELLIWVTVLWNLELQYDYFLKFLFFSCQNSHSCLFFPWTIKMIVILMVYDNTNIWNTEDLFLLSCISIHSYSCLLSCLCMCMDIFKQCARHFICNIVCINKLRTRMVLSSIRKYLYSFLSVACWHHNSGITSVQL